MIASSVSLSICCNSHPKMLRLARVLPARLPKDTLLLDKHRLTCPVACHHQFRGIDHVSAMQKIVQDTGHSSLKERACCRLQVLHDPVLRPRLPGLPLGHVALSSTIILSNGPINYKRLKNFHQIRRDVMGLVTTVARPSLSTDFRWLPILCDPVQRFLP